MAHVSATAEAQILTFETIIPFTSINTSNPHTQPPTMSFLGSNPSATSSDVKTAVVQQLQQESAMSNARSLINVRQKWTRASINPRLLAFFSPP